MRRDLAPVALFAYRRADHLERTLASLRLCPEAAETHVVVFSDGPKGPDDHVAVRAVREVLASVPGFASVRVVEREGNMGLARNVISGVSAVLDEWPEVIVLEDDMVVSPDFLAYMNEALELYADEPRVVSIHGYVYPTEDPLPDYFFLRGADCWGWATWRRGWAVFEEDGAGLLARLESAHLQREFDMEGSFPYTQMLKDQIAGRNDSWAVRWYASAFLAGGLTLYPGRSLVENIGLDGSGTHSEADAALVTVAHGMAPLNRIPVAESAVARRLIADARRRQRAASGSWVSRLRARVRA